MDAAVRLRSLQARKQTHVVLFAGNKLTGYMELSKRSSNASNQISCPAFLSLRKMTGPFHFCL